MDFREYALSSRKAKEYLGSFICHARGAVSELRLATDLPAH